MERYAEAMEDQADSPSPETMGSALRMYVDFLTAFESSPGKVRVFCRLCGSPILSRAAALPDRVRLRAGVVDGRLGVKISSHAFTGQAADWCAVDDDAPHYSGPRPAGP